MKKRQLPLNIVGQAKSSADKSLAWGSIVGSTAENSASEILILGDIGTWNIGSKAFVDHIKAEGEKSATLHVKVGSLGGSFETGMAIYDALKNCSARVVAEVVGIAASMGSVITSAADEVVIPENAWVMAHRPYAPTGSLPALNAEEMSEASKSMYEAEDLMLGAYHQKTGKPISELKSILSENTWLKGQDAIDAGFADNLTDAVEAFGSITTSKLEEYPDMPNEAKKMIGLVGQVPSSSQQPETPPAAPVVKPEGSLSPNVNEPVVSPEINEVNIKAAALNDEKLRREAVKSTFSGFSAHADLMNTCLDDMSCTVGMAQEKLLAALGAEAQPAGGQPAAGVAGHFTNGNIVKDGMVNAIAARAGIEAPEGDNNYVGLTLIEAARACLTERGVSAYGQDRMQVVGSAFTHSTSDFGNILQDVARKSLEMGYEEAEETFQEWTTEGNLSDFKINKTVAMESFPTLDRVPEGGEYKQATFGDRGESIQLATYGKLFSITRQAIINDDLDAFTTIPRNMGMAAIRTVGNLVYALLLGSPKMSDGKNMFHADHGNLITAAYPDVDSLQAARIAMGLQKDGTGTPLNIRPEFIITSLSQEAAVKTLLAAEFDPNTSDIKVPNIVRNMAAVVSDARIDHADTNAFKPWFALNKKAIKVAYLDGNKTPQLDQQNGWNVDGTQFKVRLDAGVAPMSYRSAVKNPGKAPA